MIDIELPIPPPLNNLFNNVPGRGRARSAAYIGWISWAGWMVKAAKVQPVRGEYSFSIEIAKDDPADTDARIKALLDLFAPPQGRSKTGLGLTDGDGKQCVRLLVERVHRPSETCRVVIRSQNRRELSA